MSIQAENKIAIVLICLFIASLGVPAFVSIDSVNSVYKISTEPIQNSDVYDDATVISYESLTQEDKKLLRKHLNTDVQENSKNQYSVQLSGTYSGEYIVLDERYYPIIDGLKHEMSFAGHIIVLVQSMLFLLTLMGISNSYRDFVQYVVNIGQPSTNGTWKSVCCFIVLIFFLGISTLLLFRLLVPIQTTYQASVVSAISPQQIPNSSIVFDSAKLIDADYVRFQTAVAKDSGIISTQTDSNYLTTGYPIFENIQYITSGGEYYTVTQEMVTEDNKLLVGGVTLFCTIIEIGCILFHIPER